MVRLATHADDSHGRRESFLVTGFRLHPIVAEHPLCAIHRLDNFRFRKGNGGLWCKQRVSHRVHCYFRELGRG